MCQPSWVLDSHFCCTFKDTYCTASLRLTFSILDLGQNGHHLYQSPAQPRTRENDAANNIITALVHISLIWQKPSLSSVSHMVQCTIIGGRASIKDQTLYGAQCKTQFLLTLLNQVQNFTWKNNHGPERFTKYFNSTQHTVSSKMGLASLSPRRDSMSIFSEFSCTSRTTEPTLNSCFHWLSCASDLNVFPYFFY